MASVRASFLWAPYLPGSGEPDPDPAMRFMRGTRRHRRRWPVALSPGTVLAACLLLAGGRAAAVDTLVVGQGTKASNWRSIADWGEVDRVTVTYDSVFKWDVAPRDNLVPGLALRGGRVTATYATVEEDSVVEVTGPLPGLEFLVDGDGATAFDPDRAGQTGVPRDLRVTVDLGAPFAVNRVRLYPRLDEEHRILFPQEFGVATSETGLDGSYVPVPTLTFVPLQPNGEPIVDRHFASRSARFVEVRMAAVHPWELAELEVYGDGSVPVGTYQSIPLPARDAYPVWGRVRYEGGDLSSLPVTLQTRTGPDRYPIEYFRLTGIGDDVEAVAAGMWSVLPEEERGPVRANPEWTGWSTVTDGVVRSTEVHRYLQFRLRFPEPGTVLRTLVFEYSQPPLVERLEAEVSPRLVPAGVEQLFTLSALAHTITSRRLTSVSTGFRQLQVLTAAPVAGVDRVRVDDVAVPFSAGLVPGEGFAVNLGRRIEQDGTFLQIEFRAAVFRDATRFELRAVDRRVAEGRLESVYQVAQEADVDLDSPGGELVVRLDPDHALHVLDRVAARPAAFSPNGDGVNDACAITFALFKLTRPAPVAVTLHDLAGRRLRTLADGERAAGEHRVDWDGRDDAGDLVAPGSYQYRVRVGGDGDGDVARHGVVGVVY